MNGTDSRLDARLDAPAARAAGDMADKDGLEQNDSQDHCFAQSDSDGAVSEGDGPIWMQLDGPSRSALPTPIAPLTNRPPAGQMQIASDNYLDSVLSFHPQSMCQAPGQRESYIGGAVPISQQHRATCDDFSSPLTSSDFEQVVHSIFAHPRHTNDLLFPSYYQFTLGNDGPTGLTALEGWNFLGANDQTVAAPDEFAKSTNDSLSTLPSLPDILTSNEKFARADSGQSSWMSLSSTEFEPGLASFLPNLPDQLFIENSSNVASKYFNNLTGLLGAFSSEYFQPGNHCSNTDSLTVDCDTTFEQEEIISPASTYHSLSNGLPAIQDYLVNSQVAVSSVTYQGRNYFVDDYIAVESADGTEFYGIIIAFVGTGEKERAEKIPDDLKRTVSFVMQWLLPDKERFQNALLEGRDLLPTDFHESNESPQLMSTEPITSISRVFFSSRRALGEEIGSRGQRTSSGPQDLEHMEPPLTHDGPFLPSVTLDTSTSQIMNLRMAMISPQVTAGQFIDMVAATMTSHTPMFLSLFGNSFVLWINWMLCEDFQRFYRYSICILNLMKEDSSVFTAEVKEVPPNHILPNTAANVLSKNLLFGHDLPRRLLSFLLAAVTFVQPLNPEKYGWCPLRARQEVATISCNGTSQSAEDLATEGALGQGSYSSSQYPFHLRQITKLAHAPSTVHCRDTETVSEATAHEASSLSMISRLVAAAMQGVPLTESELGEDNPEVNFPMLTTPAQFAEIVPGDLTNLIRSYTASCWTTLQGENLNLDDIPSKFQTVCHNRFIQGVEDALAYFIAKLMTDYLSTVLHQASMPTIGERESDLHHTGISASSAEAVGQNCSDTGDSDPRDFLARGLGLPRGSAAATVSKKRKATRKRQRDEMDIDSAWGSGAGSKAYSSSITGAVNSAASPKGSSEHTTSSKCSAEASSSDLAIKIRVFQFVERKIEEEIRLREKTGDPVEDEIARLQLLVNSVPGGP